jgi:hypothetical protein
VPVWWRDHVAFFIIMADNIINQYQDMKNNLPETEQNGIKIFSPPSRM